MEKIPEVKGFVYSENSILKFKFFCPFCNRWHHHGVPNGIDNRKKQHRNANCQSDSPYKETGYYLKKYTKAELAELEKSIKAMRESASK